MLDKMLMNLQFFAEDPNASGGSAGSGTSDSDNQPDGEAGRSDPSSSGATDTAKKYTQGDVDRMLSEKDDEITRKVKANNKSEFSEAAQSMVSSAIAYGSKRAKMTDDQKSVADSKASEKATKSMAAELKSYKAASAHNAAVSNATNALSSAGVSDAASVANFVADSDKDKQSAKTSAFIEWYTNTTDGVKKRALSPNDNPNNSSDPLTSVKSSGKKPNEMGATEYMLYRLKHHKQQG